MDRETILAYDDCCDCARAKISVSRRTRARRCYFCDGGRVVGHGRWRYVDGLWPRPAWDLCVEILTARQFLDVHALWETFPGTHACIMTKN